MNLKELAHGLFFVGILFYVGGCHCRALNICLNMAVHVWIDFTSLQQVLGVALKLGLGFQLGFNLRLLKHPI